jgi:hypothetical protein
MARYSTEKECEVLTEYAAKAQLGIVEIGVLDGETTARMSARATVPIYGIDPLVPDSMNPGLVGHAEAISKNMAHYEKFTFLNEFSYGVVEKWDKPFDLIFVDGDHRYEAVKKDFAQWWAKLSDGGALIFHDAGAVTSEPSTFGGHDGPKKLANELVQAGYDCELAVDTLRIFRKRASGGRLATFTVGYAIHNQRHLIDAIVKGIRYNLPSACDLTFLIDGSTDGSDEVLYGNLGQLVIDGRVVTIAHTPNIFERDSNNHLMEMFTTDFLVIVQDDMVLHDHKLLDNLRVVIGKYGSRLGVVGLRDGFGPGYAGMRSSPFSVTELTNRVLKPGEFYAVEMVNRGPLVVGRELVKEIGLLSGAYNKAGSYSDMDYCLRCKKAGFINVVMGAYIEHARENSTNFVLLDNENGIVFRKLWPGMA